MFVSQMMPELILRACPDRRRQERFLHREPVEVDGCLVKGRDISGTGIAVVMRESVSIGTLVQVTTHVSGNQLSTTPARVARVEPRADALIVGLQFIHQ